MKDISLIYGIFKILSLDEFHLFVKGCFHLLTELVTVMPGALSGYMSRIIPGVQYSLRYEIIL